MSEAFDIDLSKPLTEVVEEALLKYKHASLETRNKVVEYITEKYYEKYGKFPDSYFLSELANLILMDDISNRDSYKVQKEEFPFHSKAQTKRRKKKEFVALDDTLSFMNYKVKAKLSTAPPTDNRR